MATRKRRKTPPVLGEEKPPFLKKTQWFIIKEWMRDNEPFSYQQFSSMPGFDVQTLYETWMYMAEKPAIYPLTPDKWVKIKGGNQYNLLQYSEDLTEYMEKAKQIFKTATVNEFCGLKDKRFRTESLSLNRAKRLIRYLDIIIPELNVLRDLIEEEIEKPKEISEAICLPDPIQQKGTLASLIR